MIKRHLATALRKAARQFPVVTVTGPRQSGKTTLVRAVFPAYAYASLEDPDQREFATEDPRGFLGQFSGKVILDEVQRAPELFSYIQTVADRTGEPGMFILSGSQNFLLLERVSQTLAGRCAILHLLPFGRSELTGQKAMDPTRVGRSVPRRDSESLDDLFDVLFTGSYPRIHDQRLAPQDWLAGFTQTYVERDVRSIVNVGDIEAFRRFVRLCAGRSGQLLNLSHLAVDCGISHATARRWLSVLEASFIIYLLRPHNRNFNKRLIKSPKLYFIDSGMLCYLLRIRRPEDLRLHAARGAVFESWVVSEILKAYYHQALKPDLYFWRDSAGHEIDLLIDLADVLVPVEIKSGQTLGSDFFAGLNYWRTLPGQADCPAALVSGGDASYQRSEINVLSWRHWG